VLGFVLSSASMSDYDEESELARPLGGLFVLVGICLLSQFVIWIGMMTWTAFWYDDIRILLVIAQLIFFSFGSALIYLFLYRPRHEKAQGQTALQAGVSV
jgi:membrane protein implicated in regulation of membrane protease activity